MKKIKRIWDRLKRLIKEFEVADRISDGKLGNAVIAFGCFLIIAIGIIYYLLFV